MGLKFEVNLTNRWLYTIIIVGIILILGVGVLAYSSIPNPGHGADNIKVTVGGVEKTLQQAFDSGIGGIDYTQCTIKQANVWKANPGWLSCPTDYVITEALPNNWNADSYLDSFGIKCCKLK